MENSSTYTSKLAFGKDDCSNSTKEDTLDEEDVEISVANTVGVTVLKRAIKYYNITGRLGREDILGLYWIFGDTIMSAFELIDTGSVTILTSSSGCGKVLIRVFGSRGIDYYVIPGLISCQCHAFKRTGEVCKHILAAQFCIGTLPKEEYVKECDTKLNKIYHEHFVQSK